MGREDREMGRGGEGKEGEGSGEGKGEKGTKREGRRGSGVSPQTQKPNSAYA
jgi:hypothetical protein